MNLSLVLRHVLADPIHVSRAMISAQTGITRATVSRLVDELVSAGIVQEIAPTTTTGRGRPAVGLAPRPRAVIALGLEANIGYLAARVIDLGGSILAEETQEGDFAGSDPDATMSALATLSHRALVSVTHTGRGRNPLFLGSALALPGLVSPDALTLAPNLGWSDLPLTQLLAPFGDLGVTLVANEADLAAFAVATPRPGVPTGPSSFIYVSGEVGIGAGLIVDHRPFPGTHGWSGEIGHICTDPNGPRCACGATGCLEAYLGRRALSRRAGLPRDATPTDVVTVAKAGSERARIALDEGGVALGRALAAVVSTVDIPLILLGGNLAEISGALLPRAVEELDTRVLHSAWSHPEFRAIEEPTRLAPVGAAHRVLQRVVDDPMAWTAPIHARSDIDL